MDRRVFLKSVGSVVSVAAGIPVGAVDFSGTPISPYGVPAQEPFFGVDCWLPLGGIAISDLFHAMLDEVELVRVRFADVQAASFEKWSEGTGHSGRWFRPDLVIANFRPTRHALHSRLLRLAASHRDTGDLVVAIVRDPDFIAPSVVCSSKLCRYLHSKGIPTFATFNRPEPTELLMDLTASEHMNFFDWGDLARILNAGPFASYSLGFASGYEAVTDALRMCASSFEEQGIILDHVRAMLLTLYTDELETFYSAVDKSGETLGLGTACKMVIKWNRAVCDSRLWLSVTAVGRLEEMVMA